MSLPSLQNDTWLPEGHHPAAWDEIIAVFGGFPLMCRLDGFDFDKTTKQPKGVVEVRL